MPRGFTIVKEWLDTHSARDKLYFFMLGFVIIFLLFFIVFLPSSRATKNTTTHYITKPYKKNKLTFNSK